MNSDTSSSTIHLPLAILALAFAVFLGTQISAASQSSGITSWQIETATKNLERMEAQETQFAEALKKGEFGVKQSDELQAQLQSLLNDLLELAKDDADAQQIIKKWNVQRNAN